MRIWLDRHTFVPLAKITHWTGRRAAIIGMEIWWKTARSKINLAPAHRVKRGERSFNCHMIQTKYKLFNHDYGLYFIFQNTFVKLHSASILLKFHWRIGVRLRTSYEKSYIASSAPPYHTTSHIVCRGLQYSPWWVHILEHKILTIFTTLLIHTFADSHPSCHNLPWLGRRRVTMVTVVEPKRTSATMVPYLHSTSMPRRRCGKNIKIVFPLFTCTRHD